MPDELETILRLVAEGKLTPNEAAPIIEALTRARTLDQTEEEEDEPFVSARDAARRARSQARQLRRAARSEAREIVRDVRHAVRHSLTGRQLRIQVSERGRKVVNLRVPLAMAEAAGRMVPGIAQHMDRIQEAIEAEMTGPIIDIEDDDGDGVLISVE
jgi:hypothetical protein